MVSKVGEEAILETALVSLLPDFEVEVGANLIFNCSLCDHQEVSEISSVAKAAHREVVQFRDLLLLQKVFIPLLVNIVKIVHPRLIMKVETISEAQRTGWNLAASNLSDTAQVPLANLKFVLSYVDPHSLTKVALMVNLLGLATKLTGMKPVDSFSQVANLHF